MAKPQLKEAELIRRWEMIRSDVCGAAALKTIKEAGWDLAAIPLDGYSWPSIVAAIPLLPNQKAGSAPRPAPKDAARRVVLWLRGLARAVQDASRIEARDTRERVIYMDGAPEISPKRLRATADVIEDLALRKRWVVTRHNPRQNNVAGLRWTVRQKCGTPMDEAILNLLDAAFRAAGKGGVPYDQEALKKLETTERKIRMNARRKLGN